MFDISGKTLILRCKAQSVSQSGITNYISMAAVDAYKDKVRPHRAVFDIASEIQLRSLNVNFLDAHSLRKMYLQQFPGKSEKSGLELLEWFILKNKDQHFFIDELFLYGYDVDDIRRVYSLLGGLMKQCTGHVWVAVRKTGLSKDRVKVMKSCLSDLEKQGVCIADLPVNMRSAGSIARISADTNALRSTYDPSILVSASLDTAPGTPVLALLSDIRSPAVLSQAFLKCFLEMGINPLTDPNQSLIIIVGSASYASGVITALSHPNMSASTTTTSQPTTTQPSITSPSSTNTTTPPSITSPSSTTTLPTTPSPPITTSLLTTSSFLPSTTSPPSPTSPSTTTSKPSQNPIFSYTSVNGGDISLVEGFIKQPAGVLVTDRDAISGMEGLSVVWVGDYLAGYQRDSLLRAVVNLACITTDDSVYNKLLSAGCRDGGKFK